MVTMAQGLAAPGSPGSPGGAAGSALDGFMTPADQAAATAQGSVEAPGTASTKPTVVLGRSWTVGSAGVQVPNPYYNRPRVLKNPARGEMVTIDGQQVPFDPAWLAAGPMIQLPATPESHDPLPGTELDKARVDILNWSEKRYQDFANGLVASGNLPYDYTRQDVEDSWDFLVKKAYDYQQAGKDVTPDELAGLYPGLDFASGHLMKDEQDQLQQKAQAEAEREAAKRQKKADEEASLRPTLSTSEDSQVDLTDPITGRSIVQHALSSYIGRKATDPEVAQFQAALNQAQQANPKMTTSTRMRPPQNMRNPDGTLVPLATGVGPDGSGGTNIDDTNTSSTSSGGVDPQAFAEQYDEQHYRPEAEVYSRATNLADAMFAAMRSPV